MLLKSIAAPLLALALPLLAAADDLSTTTYTSTVTQVMTITLSRVHSVTAAGISSANYPTASPPPRCCPPPRRPGHSSSRAAAAPSPPRPSLAWPALVVAALL